MSEPETPAHEVYVSEPRLVELGETLLDIAKDNGNHAMGPLDWPDLCGCMSELLRWRTMHSGRTPDQVSTAKVPESVYEVGKPARFNWFAP